MLHLLYFVKLTHASERLKCMDNTSAVRIFIASSRKERHKNYA